MISFIDFLSLPIGYGWKQSITIFITTLILFLTSLILQKDIQKKLLLVFFSIIF